MPQPIRLLEVSGTPYEMGLAHGHAYREQIREFTADRVALAGSAIWSGRDVPRDQIITLAEACLPAHQAYAPELTAELGGIAHATGLSLPELLIANGFTDFVDVVYATYGAPATRAAVDDCTAFIIPDGVADSGGGYYGQTWDMHNTATEHVLLLRLRPEQQPAALCFTINGCVGMIGMNEYGVAVGINNLLDAAGQIGVTWPFVVRKMLQQQNVDDAVACLRGAPLAGGHNYLLFDRYGAGYSVEAMATTMHVTPLAEAPLIHTNHCLVPETRAVQQPRPEDSTSEPRLVRAGELLARRPVNLEDLMALTRDTTAICVTAMPPEYTETCGAAIMRPRSGEFWAVWGLPTENEYDSFAV